MTVVTQSNASARISPDWQDLDVDEQVRVFELADRMARRFAQNRPWFPLEDARDAALSAVERVMARYEKCENGPWPYAKSWVYGRLRRAEKRRSRLIPLEEYHVPYSYHQGYARLLAADVNKPLSEEDRALVAAIGQGEKSCEVAASWGVSTSCISRRRTKVLAKVMHTLGLGSPRQKRAARSCRLADAVSLPVRRVADRVEQVEDSSEETGVEPETPTLESTHGANSGMVTQFRTCVRMFRRVQARVTGVELLLGVSTRAERERDPVVRARGPPIADGLLSPY